MNISTAPKWIGFITLLVIFTACSQEQSVDPTEIFEKYAEISVPVELVMEVHEPDDIFFGQLGSVAADANGNLYVIDRQFNHVLNINSEGRIIETVGRAGDGPGEYRYMTNMFVARDTLYVYDFNQARLTSYSRNQDGSLSRLNDLDIQLVDGNMPRGVLKSRNNYVVEGFGVNDRGEQTGFIALLNRDGSVLNPGFMPIQIERWRMVGEGTMRMPLFRRLAHYRITTDDLFYYGWNDSLKIEVRDLSGEIINTISYDIQYYRPGIITEEILEQQPPELRNAVRDIAYSTKPAFDNMMVDEQHRVWVNLGDIYEDTPETDQWIVLNGDSELEFSFQLPRAVRFFQAQNNRMYGIYRTAEGEQSIQVYEIKI